MSELVEALRRKVCPQCRTPGRLLAGPGYDRNRIRCQHCGFKFRVS